MESESRANHRRFTFATRTILALIAVAAGLFATIGPLQDWMGSTPLAQAVEELNRDRPRSARIKGEFLTEEKVLAAIESKLEKGDAPKDVVRRLEGIAYTRRLPADCKLHSWEYSRGEDLLVGGSPMVDCHVVELRIPTGPNTGILVPICEIVVPQ